MSRSVPPTPDRRQAILRSVREAFDHIERCAELAGDNQELQALLDAVGDKLRLTVRQLRQELSPLGDVPLDGRSFGLSLERLLTQARRLGVRLEAVIAGEIDQLLSPVRAGHVLLFLREALSNAIMHADAGRVALRVEVEGRRLVIRLSDDGVGFDVSSARRAAVGGLTVMQQRAEAAGGLIQVESAPGAGTIVTFTAPLGTDCRTRAT